ncbi:8122_t:CDS:2, partial [Scutellospora calospora]
IFQAENQNLNRDLTISTSILNFENKLDLLLKILFKEQRRLNNSIELDPKKFSELITKSNFLLEGFFNEIFNVISPKSRDYQTRENDKKIAFRFCYLLARAHTLANLGISACYKTIDNYKKKIAKEYPTKISNYFIFYQNIIHVFNIDDYHSIHSYKRSDTTFLSNVYHMATCVAKRINNCAPIPAIFNNISFFNPLNIDA